MGAGIIVSAVFWRSAEADDRTPGENRQIDALVAPVALYPDNLLAKVLIASTYPLEVTEAANWLQQNGGSPDGTRGGGLQKQRWDGSVKDIARIPRLIVMMNDHLDWAQTFGDLFLSRPAAVMDAVQALRAKAANSGFLRSNDFQKVIRARDGIEIREVRTDLLYLPYYDPYALHPSSEPTRPQASWTPVPGYGNEGKISFLPGVPVSPAVWNTGLAWGERRVYVTRYRKPGNAGNPVRPSDRVSWQHDPAHRRGVSYSTPELRARYGRQSAAGAKARDAFRGYSAGAKRAGAPAKSVGQGGLRDTSYFSKHGGALDGMGEGVQIGVFSRRGHQSLSDAGGSAKPKPAGPLRP